MSDSNRLVAWTVATIAVTTAIIEAYHAYTSKTTRYRGKGRKAKEKHEEYTDTVRDYPEELIREQLARNYAFLGEDGLNKVRSKFVVIVGAGGVGSNCMAALARSGISKLRVIDFDQVSLSSLNRHSVATLKDVGTPKVECLRHRLLQIAPWVEIEAIDEVFKVENADRLISRGSPDYVIDCIDNIETKVDLLEYCVKKGLHTYSSMGASCKSDATRVNIGDISTTDEDPLARTVRIQLRKRGVRSGITCVFSAEKPDPNKAQLLPLPDEEYEKGAVNELSALQNFRVRILPVLGPVPAIFGLTLATYLITEAGGYPVEPIEGKNRYKVYDGLMHSLASQQSRIHEEQRVPITTDDASYLLEEVWRGKSPISGYSTRLTLSRWIRELPVSTSNLVVMTKNEQRTHEQRVLNGGEKVEDVYSQQVLDLVQKRFDEDRWYEKFR